MKNIVLLAALLLLILNPQRSTCFAQGSLAPPGAPAPSMKSLEQLEPRTDVLKLSGDTNYLYIIKQPGSYYLTTNVVGVSGRGGIEIAANNVTLDLNGFSLIGVTGSAQGILILNYLNPPAFVLTTNVTVRNGIITGWGASAIEDTAINAVFERLTLVANGTGFFGSDSATVRNCTVNGNLQGISVGNNSVVADCLSLNNGGCGISLQSGCQILNNNCAGNNTTHLSNAAILVSGANNRIEGNQVTGPSAPGWGIYASGDGCTNNFIVRNFVQGSGANNYFISTNQIAGPLVTSTVSGFVTNANPWANFSY